MNSSRKIGTLKELNLKNWSFKYWGKGEGKLSSPGKIKNCAPWSSWHTIVTYLDHLFQVHLLIDQILQTIVDFQQGRHSTAQLPRGPRAEAVLGLHGSLHH